MIAENNEEKRNQIWKAVMAVSTVLIIIIAAFFVIKLFTANPLEGKWAFQDSNLIMTVKKGHTVKMEWTTDSGEKKVSVNMQYSIDKDTKTFTLQANDKDIRKAAKASGGAVTASDISSVVDTMESSYDYNIEKNELTLTDREFGNQMVFDKK